MEEQRPLHSEGESTCDAAQVVDAAGWRVQQEQDTDLQPVLQWVESGRQSWWDEVVGCSPATKGLLVQFAGLRIQQVVLQRAWKELATGKDRWQVVVPRVLRESVLKACHGTTGAGHFGVSKTLRRLRQTFYWSRLRREVEDLPPL